MTAPISMAALTMNKQLGFSPATLGFGAGLFSIGYILTEIPSTLILNSVGNTGDSATSRMLPVIPVLEKR